ncbi:hypothetical protein [Kribbella italica]|uniref:Uncharacterized protein n=1 Tax=Kribbella italica TaxID=1540520 RepID=A0A7W9JGB0_9ACTN|nr:hypothetical protein [Kribbella italica]MBB5841616.1 hypothetical protein [Kribbella italica]
MPRIGHNDRAAPTGEQQRSDQPGAAVNTSHVNRFGGDFGSFISINLLDEHGRCAQADDSCPRYGNIARCLKNWNALSLQLVPGSGNSGLSGS